MSTFTGDTDAALAHMAGDKINREHWAVAFAVVFCRSLKPWVLQEIVAHGEREFYNKSQHILRGHGFTRDEFTRIFRIIKRTSELNPVDRGQFHEALLVRNRLAS